jgi:hypothetical protein
VAAQHTPPWQLELRVQGSAVVVVVVGLDVVVVVVVPHWLPGHLSLQLCPPESAQALAFSTQTPLVLPQVGAQHTAPWQSALRVQGPAVVVVVVVGAAVVVVVVVGCAVVVVVVVGCGVVVVVVVGAAVVVVVVVEHGPHLPVS